MNIYVSSRGLAQFVIVVALAALGGCSAEEAPPTTTRGSSSSSGGRPVTPVTPGRGAAGTSSTTAPDFGSRPGTLAGSPAPSSFAGNGAMLPGGTCASGMADTRPITPVIWLVVDGSSSMTESFGASDRWTTLRSTLMDPGGVVDSLQSLAKFGMVIYSGGGGGGIFGGTGECVQLVTVDPALNNHAALLAKYPTEPIGSGTPTDKALDHVVTKLPVISQATLDTTGDPVYVVLATDGQPNEGCGGGGRGGGGQVEQRVVDVTTKGTMNGMQMFVISLAGGDPMLQSHLEQVAAATASKTPPFVPSTQAELVTTFRDIIGGASCQIDLKGQVEMGKECGGTVTLNGQNLDCASDNGWRLIDPNTFALTGSACDSFTRQQSKVSAMFPCDVFRPE